MFRNFLRGRYGVDSLSTVILFIAVILLNIKYSWIIGIVLAGFAIFRIFSKNINKRYQERMKFERILKLSKNKFMGIKTKYKQRKDFVFIKCRQCKKTLRLPKNKGKLQGKCPLCGFEFLIKT